MDKQEYQKGVLLNIGKTKEIYEAELTGGKNMVEKTLVIVKNKRDVTAFNDENMTQQMEEKDVFATNTACRVFELLRDCGIPVAYEKQLSPTEFLAKKCSMISLEIIGRRYVRKGSSYLNRNPDLQLNLEGDAFRFRNLKVELFLKTTKGKLVIDGKTLVKGLAKKDDDPIIADFNEKKWRLLRPYKPTWDPDCDLNITIDRDVILPKGVTVEMITNLLTRVFLVLEAAWNILGFRMLDIKIEVGITKDGKLVVSDVVDNDSWRIVNFNWIDFSKQSFRDGEPIEEVKRKYKVIADKVNQFRIPKHVLVLWFGSPNDKLTEKAKEQADLARDMGIDIVTVVFSGHKQTSLALNKLEELHALYPEGGVVIDFIGRSNGGGPTLAAHTIWPVINAPTTIKEFPNDIWSNIRMPSDVPCTTAWPEENAIEAALNILAMKNPRIYMERKRMTEQLDT